MEGCDTHRRLRFAYGKGKSNPAKLYDSNMTAVSLLQSKYYFCLADGRCSLLRSLSFCLIWMEWFSLTWKQEAPTTCNSSFCPLEKNGTLPTKGICVLRPSCARGKRSLLTATSGNESRLSPRWPRKPQGSPDPATCRDIGFLGSSRVGQSGPHDSISLIGPSILGTVLFWAQGAFIEMH